MRFFVRPTVFNGVVLLSTCAVLVYTFEVGLDSKSSSAYCTLLGIVIFTKWMQLLFSLCQFPIFGMHILPITSTMFDIGPFCVVMAVCIMSAANLYYALNIHGPMRSFMIMYRLVILSEVNPDDLENVFGTDMRVDADGTILQTISSKTKYYFVVQGVMVFISFIMSVALMNLFIAVLTVSYRAYAEKALVSFSRHQALKVLEAQAMRAGWTAMKRGMCGICRKRHEAIRFDEDEEEDDPESMTPTYTEAHRGGSYGGFSLSVAGFGRPPKPTATGMEARSSSGGGSSRPTVFGHEEGHEVSAKSVQGADDVFMWLCLPSTS